MTSMVETDTRIKCTYIDCEELFASESAMKQHKKHSDEHDYCHKCDKDFETYEDLSHHKAFAPDKHGKACRVCGEEFKSTSGLKRHVELTHKVDQELPCLGCGEVFRCASALVEHIEFGHCSVVRPEQFMGHIIHKNLITELLSGGPSYERFMQKISMYEAAQDHDEDGGVNLTKDILSTNDGDEVAAVLHQSRRSNDTQYPPLPSKKSRQGTLDGELTSGMHSLSLRGGAAASPDLQPNSPSYPPSAASNHQLKPWVVPSSKHSVSTFKPSATQSEFSVSAHDEQMSAQHGINIMSTRFWDPWSPDWAPERFYNEIIQIYYCPFPCEQTFPTAAAMKQHILNDHRLTRVTCPRCFRPFDCVTGLIRHCESRGSRCQISAADDFNIFLDRMTGGFLSAREETRPDHVVNPSVMVRDRVTGRMEKYTPPGVGYLKYSASKPVDWKEPRKVLQIGSGGAMVEGAGKVYDGDLRRWE